MLLILVYSERSPGLSSHISALHLQEGLRVLPASAPQAHHARLPATSERISATPLQTLQPDPGDALGIQAAFKQIQLLVSDDDVNNYNKIKTDLDKLRLLVEQSELWIYKKKDYQKGDDKNEDAKSQQSSNSTQRAQNVMDGSGAVFVLQELDNGPELDNAAILKYKQLYRILFNMIQLCVSEKHMPNGTIKKKARRNDQRLLRNMGVHNIVLDLTKIT